VQLRYIDAGHRYVIGVCYSALAKYYFDANVAKGRRTREGTMPLYIIGPQWNWNVSIEGIVSRLRAIRTEIINFPPARN